LGGSPCRRSGRNQRARRVPLRLCFALLCSVLLILRACAHPPCCRRTSILRQGLPPTRVPYEAAVTGRKARRGARRKRARRCRYRTYLQRPRPVAADPQAMDGRRAPSGVDFFPLAFFGHSKKGDSLAGCERNTQGRESVFVATYQHIRWLPAFAGMTKYDTQPRRNRK